MNKEPQLIVRARRLLALSCLVPVLLGVTAKQAPVAAVAQSPSAETGPSSALTGTVTYTETYRYQNRHQSSGHTETKDRTVKATWATHGRQNYRYSTLYTQAITATSALEYTDHHFSSDTSTIDVVCTDGGPHLQVTHTTSTELRQVPAHEMANRRRGGLRNRVEPIRLALCYPQHRP